MSEPIHFFRLKAGGHWTMTTPDGVARLKDMDCFEFAQFVAREFAPAPAISDAEIDDCLGELHKFAYRVNPVSYGLPLHDVESTEQLRAVIRALLNREVKAA